MAATIWRELRLVLPRLTIITVLFALFAVGQSLDLRGGRWVIFLLVPSANWYSQGLLHAPAGVFCFACLACGLLNALSQFALRSRGEWAFLLHRPSSRLHLLTGVLVAGLLATVAFPGVLWTVLWWQVHAVSGDLGAPWRHLAEGWVFALWGLTVYLGTALACLDGLGRRLGRLLGPGLVATAVLYGLLVAPALAWCLGVAAVTSTLLLVQLYDCFARREF
jgi:hypothetical protein